MQRIVLITIIDRSDFNAKLDRCAFHDPQAAHDWYIHRVAYFVDGHDFPEEVTVEIEHLDLQ